MTKSHVAYYFDHPDLDICFTKSEHETYLEVGLTFVELQMKVFTYGDFLVQ